MDRQQELEVLRGWLEVAAGGAQFSRRRKFSSQPFSAVYLVPPYLPNSRRWIGAEGGGFERGVPGYPRYLYLGEASRGEHHLVIKGATLEDDGEYQCQVGPTDTTPPIWAAANLTVMVSPTSISIVDVGDGGVVEVQEGHTLRLECLVKGARPPAAVTWYRDAITLRKDLHREEVVPSKDSLRWDVRSRLALKVEAGDDGQEFSCRALHPALQHAPTTLVASLTVAVLRDHSVNNQSPRGSQDAPHVCRSPGVKVLNTSNTVALGQICAESPKMSAYDIVVKEQNPPDPPTITGYRTGDVLAVGDHRTLVCQVKGGRPRPFVTWYRHGRPLTHAPAHQPTSASLTTAVPPTSATTVSTTARERTIRVEQRVTAAREEDEADPPEDVTILGPTVVAAGQLFTLTCRSSPANPPPTLTWRLQEEVRCASASDYGPKFDDNDEYIYISFFPSAFFPIARVPHSLWSRSSERGGLAAGG
ncbi:nephrin-like [Scylla paramamosain]|uniref:nephrin-like n=1 Tax=Scylla paramamosain TaxID=85552 RepID=UPI003082A915